MTIAKGRWGFLVAGIALLWSGAALAASPPKSPPPTPTPEQRRTMAEIHQKMAACLLSDRPISDCRAEMHSSCQQQLGRGGCPMMGWGGGGMMGGGGPGPHMWQGSPPSQPPAPPSQ